MTSTLRASASATLDRCCTMYIGKALVQCMLYERALALDIKFHLRFNIKFNIDRLHQMGINRPVHADLMMDAGQELHHQRHPSSTNMSTPTSKLRAAILVVSETASRDPSTDKCIPILKDVFEKAGNDQWDVAVTEIVTDNVLAIQKTIRNWTDGPEPINLVVSSGGTGFATKDVTPEVCGNCKVSRSMTDDAGRLLHHF